MLTIGQDIISGNMGYIGTEPGRLYRMGPRSKVAEASGEPPVVLENCKKKPLKGLKIYGRSIQKTTTGAQLLEKNIVVHPTSGKVSTIVLFEGELSGTYTVSCELEGEAQYPTRAALEIIVDGVEKFCTINNHTVVSGTITKIECFAQNTYCDFTGTLNIMLNAGSAPLPWEPYTGGKPSPSPDYPQEIESVGTKWSTGANLVDVHNAIKINTYGLEVTVKDDGTIVVSGTSSNNAKNLSFSFLDNKFSFPLTSIFKLFDVEEKNCKLSSVRRTNASDATNNKIAIDINQINSGDPIYCSFKLVVSEKAVEEYEPYTGGVPKPYGDKIRVGVMGKNLLDPAQAYQSTTSNYRMYKDGFLLKKGVTYTLSCYPSKADGLYIIGVPDYDKLLAVSYKKSFVTYTPNEDVMVTFNYYLDGKLDPKTSKLMLEIGENPNPSYEPYLEPQLTDIATPNGLPGIPVSADGNYTDAYRRQWVCDEIDFARGVYVQRVVKIQASQLKWNEIKETTWVTLYDDSVIMRTVSYLGKTNSLRNNLVRASAFSYNSYLVYSKNIEGCEVADSQIRVRVKVTSFDEAVEKIQDAYFLCALTTPVETPLTSDQLAAYKALRTYKGTTIIDNDAGAYMTIKYNT
mgnify:CR=1 FL=1